MPFRIPSNNIFTLAAALAAAAFAPRASAQPEVIDRVVAVVGRECILLSDLRAQVEFAVLNNRVDPATPGLREQVLDAMINEKLILARAVEDTNISVSEDEVTNQIEALIAQRVRQAGSEKRLEEAFGMPISKMKREFRDEMRKQIMGAKLWEIKKSSISASRREVEEFYARYKDSLPRVPEELELYHILRIPAAGGDALRTVRAKAAAVLDSIRGGGDFADYARRYSEDAGSAPHGGDLPFTRRGEFVKEFEEAVFSLKENQIGDLVETPFGVHIVQLLERRGESVHARHILFKTRMDSGSISSALSFLRTLADSARGGTPFAELAKKYSEDKESAPVGGFLGRLTVEEFDKSVLEATKNTPEGGISEPVPVTAGNETGYHIVYVKKRIPEHAMSLESDWNRIEQLATDDKRNREYQSWIKKLRDEVYWEQRLTPKETE